MGAHTRSNNTCCKRFTFILIGFLFTTSQLLYFFSAPLKQSCSHPTFTLRSFKLEDLCSNYNSYQATLEVDSSCPLTISLVDFDLWFKASTEDGTSQTLAGTHITAFDINPGKNIIKLDRGLSIDDAYQNYTHLHALAQMASEGYSVRLTATADVKGSILGFSVSQNVQQDLGCINCDDDEYGSDSASTSGGGYGGKYTMPKIRVKSIDSGAPRDEHTFESSFTLQVDSIAMDSFVINIPTIDLDIYESATYLGTVRIHEVQFGNVSNMIPLSTLFHQSEVAKVILKAIQHHEAPPTLTVYGSTRDFPECGIQQVIAGVKLGSVPLPKWDIKDLLPYLDLPSVALNDIVTSGTLHVNVPLYLDVAFKLFSLPTMVFEVDAAPVGNPIAVITVPVFTLTPSALQITIALKTIDPRLLQAFVNSLIVHTPYPVDVKWTVGSQTIFEIFSYNTYVDYADIQYLATSWANQGGFSIEASASHNDTGAVQAYSASLSVEVYSGYYQTTLFDTGRLPLFYKDEYFGDGEISITTNYGYITFTSAAYISNNGSVLNEIYTDLRNNRLPPGIRLISVGNTNIQVGSVIDTIVDYLGDEIQVYNGEYIELSDFGRVDSFSYGNNHGVIYMTTSLWAGYGVQRVFQLDKITIYPNTASLNVTLAGGKNIQASIFSSFFNPQLNFAFYLSQNSTELGFIEDKFNHDLPTRSEKQQKVVIA